MLLKMNEQRSQKNDFHSQTFPDQRSENQSKQHNNPTANNDIMP